MNRKNLFLIPVVFLMFASCFIATSCFSGLNEDKGELSFTFTQPMLSNILSRSAVARAGEIDDDKGSEYVDEKYNEIVPKIRVELKTNGRTYEKEVDIVEVEYAAIGKAREVLDEPSMQDGRAEPQYYVLFAYSNGKYVIQGYDFDSRTLKSVLSDGNWSFGSNDQIIVNENGNSKSQSFYYKEGEGFEVEAGGKIIWFSEEYFTEDFVENFKYLPVTVKFDNLRVGARAKVSAEVSYSIPGHDRQVVASGTSDDFVIEQNTVVTVNMKLKNSYEPDPYYKDCPTYNVSIKGFEKNDFTDLGTDICTVTLYEVVNSSIMQIIKTTLANEELTDAKKASVLIPYMKENVLTLGSFNPGTAYSENEEIISGSSSKILDDGTIQFTEKFYTSAGKSEGGKYGILATVSFSKNDNYDYYDFAIGFTDDLTYSSSVIDAEISVSEMNIPLSIYFYLDNSGYYDNKYTINSAITNLELTDNIQDTESSVMNEIFDLASSSIDALKDMGYEYDSANTPVYGTESGIPFISLYFKKTGGGQGTDPIEEQDNVLSPLEIPASGNITSDNRAVVISMEYDSEALYLNQGTFTFSATYPDGSELSEEDAENLSWKAEMLYKGKNINLYGEPYYEVNGNKLVLQPQIPLPSDGDYQIYVTASLPVTENNISTISSSQTFEVNIPDRHIYDISDKVQCPWQYATNLHNVVVTGDVTEEDWENWSLSDESVEYLLKVIFAKHRNTLESLTFNGNFTSPAYTQAADSPLYNSNNASGIQFGRHVSLVFNGVATIGGYLFEGARNIETIKFTTTGSSVGDSCFRDASSITTLDLTGVTTIGSYAFAATGLKEITIPESVTLIDEGAFNGCNLSSAVFEITEGWMYVMNGDSYPANVSGSYALSTLNDVNISKLFRE